MWIKHDIQINPFLLKTSYVQESLAMIELCSEDKCDVLMISVLNWGTSRISILRSGDCTADYEINFTPQRADVFWTFQKMGSAMEVRCEKEVAARIEFSDSLDEECRRWPESYTWIHFKEHDTASIAYCTMHNGMFILY